MGPPFFWEFSWVTSRLTEAPLVLTWGLTPLALLWIPVTLLCGALMWRSRGGSLRLAEAVALIAVAGASLAGDYVGLWLCTAVFLAAAPALGEAPQRAAEPSWAVSGMQATGWIACGVWMFAFLGMWREFATFHPDDLVQGVLAAPEDVSRQAALRLIVVWLGGGALLFGGVFPTGGWIGGVSRGPGAGWVFGPGRFALASLWMLRTTPLLEIAWPGQSLFTGPAALTAVLMAFLALTADDRRSVVGLTACTLTAAAVAAAGSGQAAGAAAGLLLTLTSMLVVTPLKVLLTGDERRGTSSSTPPGDQHSGPTPPPQRSAAPPAPRERRFSSLVGWGAVVIVASGLCGQQQGVSAVTAGLNRSLDQEKTASATEATGSTPEAETARLAIAAVWGSFAAAQFLLACALTRLVCLERRGGRSAVRGGGLALLLLAAAFALPWAIPLVSETEIVLALAGPAEFGGLASPADAPGLMGLLGLLGSLAGFVLYRRPSPWPERLANRFESLDRLGRQELYLERLFRQVTNAAQSVARFWQTVDSPDRTARQHSPLAAALRGIGARLEPLWNSGGWQPALLVVATALVLWGVLIQSERRSWSDAVSPPAELDRRIDRNSPEYHSKPDRAARAARVPSPDPSLPGIVPGDGRHEPLLPLPRTHL